MKYSQNEINKMILNGQGLPPIDESLPERKEMKKIVFICDRCGREFPGVAFNLFSVEEHDSFVVKGHGEVTDDERHHYDLCPACTQKFKAWINGQMA